MSVLDEKRLSLRLPTVLKRLTNDGRANAFEMAEKSPVKSSPDWPRFNCPFFSSPYRQRCEHGTIDRCRPASEIRLRLSTNSE